MSASDPKRYLRNFGIALIAMPVVFICFYSIGGWFAPRHISIRLSLLVAFGFVAVVLAKPYLGGYALKVLPARIWLAIGILLALVASRMTLGDANVMLTVERTIMWLVYLTLGLTLFSLFNKVEPDQVLLTVLLSLVGATALYVALVGAWFWVDGAPSGPFCTNIMPGFKNVRYTAYFTAPALGLAVAVAAMRGANVSVRLLGTVLAIALWTYIEYTGARGAAVSMIAAGLLIGLVVPIQIAGRIIAAGLITAVVALGVAYFIPPADCGSFGMFNRLQSSVQSPDPGTGRVEIWSMTWELIKERPWIGYGEIRLFNWVDTPVTQPHNAVLQILLAWGFAGSAIFLLVLGEFLFRLAMAARRGPWQAWPVIFGLLTILIYGQISGALYHAFPLLFATILSAAAAALLLAPKPHPVV